jgi:Ca-activated chloride channel family protein
MQSLRPNTISRVIVLSDGDANVGPSSHQKILEIIDSRVKAGVTLSTIGFGMGNYRADLMEQLGNRGNGNNYYVDSLEAAGKLFSTDLVSMLEVAAKDAKLQVEFDPAVVARYRLLGYENRDIKDNDFRKDSVDAGEIGAGHQVTAMYEVQLTEAAKANAPLGLVRIRHKAPEGHEATENTFAMASAPAASFESATDDFRFAFAVASFADMLRGAEDAQGWSLDHAIAVARSTARGDKDRLELVELMMKARSLRGSKTTVAR